MHVLWIKLPWLISNTATENIVILNIKPLLFSFAVGQFCDGDALDQSQKPGNGSAISQYILLSKSVTGVAAAELIEQAVDAPGVYVFSELLDMPNIRDVRQNNFVLVIFASNHIGIRLLGQEEQLSWVTNGILVLRMNWR